MVIDVLQWFNNYQNILGLHLLGIAMLGSATATGNVLLSLGKRAKTIEAKQKIYFLSNRDIQHPLAALIFTITGITLANKAGANIDSAWLLALLFLTGSLIGGGITGYGVFTEELYQTVKAARDINDPKLKAVESFQNNILRKIFLNLNWPAFFLLVYLGYCKPSPVLWPSEQLHHFLQNSNIVVRQIVLFSPFVAGILFGTLISIPTWSKPDKKEA